MMILDVHHPYYKNLRGGCISSTDESSCYISSSDELQREDVKMPYK